MTRKPTKLAGGKSPRQRVWEMIRAMNGKPFDVRDVTPGNVQTVSSRDYLVGLALAGYLTVVQQGKAPRVPAIYQLVRDVGAEAPRVTKHGEIVTLGSGNEAIWGAMQALGAFTVAVLAKMSGAQPNTVKSYVRPLVKAGYLTVEREGKGGLPSQYRLLKSHVHGPRPPVITSLRAVYDPNIHKIVWQQSADEVLEGLDK